VFVPFFGRPAHTPPGPAIVALRNRTPLLTTFIERRPEGGHRIHFDRMALDGAAAPGSIADVTARLTAAIEAQIRRVPVEWVWWHERWRRQPGVRRSAVRRPS
jgi:KDO2-lipid IV(A) lauroyltransferase